MTNQSNFDALIRDVLAENTAQIVRKHLMALESNRANVITRWVWELLQNARDASPEGATNLVASFEVGESDVVFQHNGREFREIEIAHLIYHGSTKTEDEEAIGQYGSGFLTTHLLSPEIKVSGRIEDGQPFDFSLKREIASHQELSASMNRAKDAFQASLGNSNALKQSGFTTRFGYPIIREDALDVVTEGIETLKRCAPFVMVFNHEFSSIMVKTSDELVRFKVNDRVELQDGLIEVSVEESENSAQTITKYLVAPGDMASVAIPFKSDGAAHMCLELKEVSKLFLGFPLVGTEAFSFPAIINSFDFTPTEERNGVYLWRGKTDANLSNQAVIEEACELLTTIVGFAASSDWRNVYRLVNIPALRGYDWVDDKELRQSHKNRLVAPIRQTLAVLGDHSGMPIAPEKAILPIAESEEGVTALWDLLNDLNEFRPKLPRREEAFGWCKAVENWTAIRDPEADPLPEAFDGRMLAAHIQKETAISSFLGTLDNLRNMLNEDVCPVKWLDRLYAFLLKNGFDREVSNHRIVLDQSGRFNTISNLYRDKGIDDELKRISDDVLALGIRKDLRDVRLTSLNDKAGKGDYDNKNVADRIITELKKQAEDNNLSDEFANASVRLLAWIVSAEQWDCMSGFPAFSLSNTDDRRVIWLNQAGASESDIPLAPVKAWPNDLQQYEDIFPQSRILACDFYNVMKSASDWQKLVGKGYVQLDVVITSEEYCGDFLPDEPLPDVNDVEHETSRMVERTDIVFLQRDRIGIMERVRSSPTRARLFWKFLTEWLIVRDPEGVTVKEAKCDCDNWHNYYPAAWLVPLVKNRWVPIGDSKRDWVSAKSLATLFRGRTEEFSIPENDAVSNFLKAIRVSPLELTIQSVAGTDDPEEVESKVANILSMTGGNLQKLDMAVSIMEQMEDDPNLPQILDQLKDDPALTDYLADRRQQRQTVHRNQRLGGLVEDLVKENLEHAGFEVSRTRVGADLVVKLGGVEQDEQEEITKLELVKDARRWEVEVKATRDNDVRMTPAQAKNAMDLGNGFLLCVVPIEGDDELDLEYVRDRMRFVEEMGERVEPLYDALDEFEEQRKDITGDDGDGVKLEVMNGNPRFSVDRSVWEYDGFELGELAARLDPGGKGKGV